jgi:DNA-directed RNA polymerase subunit H (RpoH/RPB5)
MNNPRSNRYLLDLKKASIRMAIAGNYNVDEDRPVLDYKPGDIRKYFDYAFENASSNAIRNALELKGQLTKRSSLSTLYESIDRPNHFILFYFVYTPKESSSKFVGKEIILIPNTLRTMYGPMKQKYCEECINNQNEIKRCFKCPTPQFCKTCTESLKCENCPENKLCPTCVVKLRKMNIFSLAREKCGMCTKSEYCQRCKEMRSGQECKECANFTKQSEKDSCQNCISKLKCKDCDPSRTEEKGKSKSKKEIEFCEDCQTKFDFKKCEECPPPNFCNECIKINKIKPCKDCPPPPQIIERCVIITETQLSPDAKQVASANIPRIKASTGEWIEVGCLVQVYMDYEMFYNPLVHSLGSRYQVMSTEQTIEFFKNKNNSVTESQIFQADMAGPVARYLGLYPGQLLRIEREILVPGTMITHEVVYRLIRLIPVVKKNRRRNLKKKVNTNISGAVEDEY